MIQPGMPVKTIDNNWWLVLRLPDERDMYLLSPLFGVDREPKRVPYYSVVEVGR